jgi:ribose 5-phosphate isomerase A
MTDATALKRESALRALEFVEPGMKLGLGTGSTAEAFLEMLGARVRGGLMITGVATSERTAQIARTLGIPLADLDSMAPLDLAIDGTDEADRALTLIKGGGGALLREKIVAASSRRMVAIADSSKLVERLGRFALPVEVNAFGHATTSTRVAAALAALGYRDVLITLRQREGKTFMTDGGNVIYDCALGAIEDAAPLAQVISAVPGVADHGLFVGIAHTLVIASEVGVEVIERKT